VTIRLLAEALPGKTRQAQTSSCHSEVCGIDRQQTSRADVAHSMSARVQVSGKRNANDQV
jgi:hypothetical protein